MQLYDSSSSSSGLPLLKSASGTKPSFELSQSSFSTASRPSNSSLSFDNSALGSERRNRKPFKPVSYFFERQLQQNQDTLNHFQRVSKTHKATLASLIEEKSEIQTAIKREESHIVNVNQKFDEQEKSIYQSLEILRNAKNEKDTDDDPPSISQIRKISDAILREGLKFKQMSEQPQRIEQEMLTARSDGYSEPCLTLQQTVYDGDLKFDDIEFQRNRLSSLVFRYEDASLRLEAVLSNREMLNRVIFDYNTHLEALKLKKENLMEEGKKLEDDFNDLLSKYATQLGELMWKNQMINACNEIASIKKEN
ncbi:hypothetical protein GPJ56_009010 [Histomonas meleagridis]|uniref:uncharacterized protein n=1 Tax=Histomonas meleagridis TaxID=135588 RepID=UPI00355A116A|nr:hypothetical protein GPJ56_009010 [Histomonas meleagridis]KAH0799335.1 hypothetical protein GO595_008132 [Histomonas meleagridis]